LKARLLTCCAWLLTTSPLAFAASSRESLPNQVAVEVGGRTPFLGIGYERWLNDVIGIGAGVGGFPCVECSIGNSGAYGGYFVVSFPVYFAVNVPVTQSQGVILSAGATLAVPGHGQESELTPSLGAGYDLLLGGGFVLRPSLLLLFHPYADPGDRRIPAQLWAGLHVGWAF